MAEVLAAGTRLAGIFASGCARVVASGAALQRACGSDSADATVSANSRGQAGTLRPSACFAAVCGIVAGVGAGWLAGGRDGDALGICRGHGFQASGSGGAGDTALLGAS